MSRFSLSLVCPVQCCPRWCSFHTCDTRRCLSSGRGTNRSKIMILRGYIDESKGGDIFNLTAVIADGGTWFYFEQDWIRIIDAKNAELKAQGRKPISRYHATDAQFREKEFKGWERDEKDQFCISLF